ncbi:MAG: transporter [Dehalococcoidia bacterium]|nr:transporter [Dehalococcoidia bacterium]
MATESATVRAQSVKRGGIFYGYWVVVAGAALAAINGGLYFYGFSAFFKPVIAELGTTRAVLSGAFSLARLEGGLIGPIEGWLIDKFGPRKVLFAGIPLLAIGFFLMSGVNSVLMFYIVFVLFLSLGSALGAIAPVSTAVANWFDKKRGTMLGLLLAGVGVGSGLVPGVTMLITLVGWRNASWILGVVVLVTGIPLAAVIRHKPEQYGYYPDNEAPRDRGEPEEGRDSSSPGGKGAADKDGLTTREALRTPAFWLMAFSFALRVGVSSSVALHFIPFLTDIGFSLNAAGLMVSVMGMLGIVGRLGFGWLGDKFPKRYVVAGGLLSMALGMVILAFSTSLWHVLVALLVYAPSYGGLATMMFAMRAEYFGRKSFATIQGFMGTVMALGTISGPIYAGWVFDVTNSYRIAFLTFAVATFLAIFLILAARKPLAIPSDTAGAA